MKNYWIYFCASLLSLIGSNFVIFTQGWYLLKITNERTSVGITWGLLFLPSLIFLPMIGKLLDSGRLKTVILTCEVSKFILLISFFFILRSFPSKAMVYLFAVLYGIFFAPYYASVYVVVKKIIPHDLQTKYSHFFEVSLQFANIVAVLSAGFLFERLGFQILMLLSAIFVLIGFIGMVSVSFSEEKINSGGLFSGYREMLSLIGKPLLEKGISKENFLFGLLHTFPQSVILVGNVALTLYVFDVMKKGAATFGVVDALISVAAFGVSLFWVKYHKLSERNEVIISMSILAAISVGGMAAISSTGIVPYIWMGFYGIALISSKILARAAVVRVIPKERIGEFSILFQTGGYAGMMCLFCLVSLLSNRVGAAGLFLILGALLLVYSGVVSILLLSPKPGKGAFLWRHRRREVSKVTAL